MNIVFPPSLVFCTVTEKKVSSIHSGLVTLTPQHAEKGLWLDKVQKPLACAQKDAPRSL